MSRSEGEDGVGESDFGPLKVVTKRTPSSTWLGGGVYERNRRCSAPVLVCCGGWGGLCECGA